MENAPRRSANSNIDIKHPFSIDYILSSSAVAAAAKQQQQQHHPHHHHHQQHQQDQAEHPSGEQQRARLALLAAGSAEPVASEPPTQAPIAMPPINLLQQAHPNFLYFMACMLLQRQRQQNIQQSIQQQQQQALVQQQHQHQADSHQQQAARPARQPIDLARGHVDSLAVLARLTGGGAGAHTRHPEPPSLVGKHLRPQTHSSVRSQPYSAGGAARASFATGPISGPAQHSHAGPAGPTSIQQQGPVAHQRLAGEPNSSNIQLSCAPTDKLDNLKPAHSYIGLIGMCILSSAEKRMVLNDIYQFILDNYPYYRNRGSGWRNSVRHNLSLNECFQKAGRAANGKGHYWTIHPANMEDFMMGDFRRRRAQRKVRRWNNMDVPSDESDDESVDDANKPPLPEHFKRSIEMHRRIELSYQKSATEATMAAAQQYIYARQQQQQQQQQQ